MVRRRVEHPFQRPKLPDRFRVNPKLVEEIKLDVDEQGRERNPQESERVVEEDPEGSLEDGLAEGGGEVVFLGRMVDVVSRPTEGCVWGIVLVLTINHCFWD